VAVEQLTSVTGIAQLSLARILILLALLDSWLFLFTGQHICAPWTLPYSPSLLGGIVIFGAGLESTSTTCALGIYLCIVFYATSKALIYFFLGTVPLPEGFSQLTYT
jgi:hypothetical protein